MSKPPKFIPKKCRDGWRLNIPPSYSINGRRRTPCYPTREKANDAAKILRERRDQFGVNATAITPLLAHQATVCEELLRPLGIGLVEAITRFVQDETKRRASVSVEAAVMAFRATGEAWSEKQERAYRLRGEKLIEAFPDRLISTVTGDDLKTHLSKTTGGDGAYNHAIRLVRAIWNWSAKAPRKWCELDAIEQLEMRKTVKKEIGVLSYEQALAVMRSAENNHPETALAFAVSLFTGLRQAELRRISKEHITDDGITLRSISSKTERRRFIQMPEPLLKWFRAYPPEDDLTPPDWSRLQTAVRRKAGFRLWSPIVEPNTPPPELDEWPHNALRHTAATVAVAIGKELSALIFEHGHSGGTEMLKAHYLGAMSKAEAELIWSIEPMKKL